MTVRRITTGIDAGGRSVPAPTPSQTLTYYPPVDGVRFQVLTVPPDGAAMRDDLDTRRRTAGVGGPG